MTETQDKHDYDVQCPNCMALLKVDDSEDFEHQGLMYREDDYWMVCPKCETDIKVHVVWEPTYTDWGMS
jgi:MinD superfamily P-loop ATPase